MAAGRSAWRRWRRAHPRPLPDTPFVSGPRRSEAVATGAAVAVAGVGPFVAAPLAAASVPLVLLGSRTLFGDALAALDRRRIEFVHVDAGLVVVCLATGSFLLASAGSAFYLAWSALDAAQRRRDEGQATPSAASDDTRPVWLDTAAGVVQVPLATLGQHDRISVRQGDELDIGGRIVGGMLRVDRQAVTGALVPTDLGPDDRLEPGDRVVEGQATLAVSAGGADPRAPLRETGDRPGPPDPISVRGRRLADSTVSMSGLTAALAGLTLSGGAAAVALASNAFGGWRLAAPLALEHLIQRQAARGVFAARGTAIELLAPVDLLVVDRLALLDANRREVAEVFDLGSSDLGSTVEIATGLARGRGDAIGDALVEAALLRDADVPTTNGPVTARAGVLGGIMEGRTVLFGPLPALAARGVRGLDSAERWAGRAARRGRSTRGVAVDGEAVGVVAFDAPLHDGTADWLSSVRRMGVELMLVGADPEPAVAATGREAGIDGWSSALDPDEKRSMVEALRTSGRMVAYFGGRLADRPALMAADLALVPGGADPDVRNGADLTIADAAALPDAIAAARDYHRGQGKAMVLSGGLSFAGAVGVLAFGFGWPHAVALQAFAIGGGVALAAPARVPRIDAEPVEAATEAG